MASTKRRWPLILAGVAVFIGIFVAALAVIATVLFRDHVEVAEGTSREAATAAFATAKQAFPDARPLLLMDADRRPQYSPGVETRRNPGSVSAVHVLAWDADDGALATVRLPMWLLRLKSGPIVFDDYVDDLDDKGIALETKDLDRFGPGVVFEFEAPDGDHVLLTAR